MTVQAFRREINLAKNMPQLLRQPEEASSFSFLQDSYFSKDAHHIIVSSFESIMPLIVVVGNVKIVH
jgi:hypothetical protein